MSGFGSYETHGLGHLGPLSAGHRTRLRKPAMPRVDPKGTPTLVRGDYAGIQLIQPRFIVAIRLDAGMGPLTACDYPFPVSCVLRRL
jgi:hypothetical protein